MYATVKPSKRVHLAVGEDAHIVAVEYGDHHQLRVLKNLRHENPRIT